MSTIHSKCSNLNINTSIVDNLTPPISSNHIKSANTKLSQINNLFADTGSTHILLPPSHQHLMTIIPTMAPLPGPIIQPDGTHLHASQAGITTFAPNLHLQSYIVPGIKVPLGGIDPFTQRGFQVTFTKDNVTVYDGNKPLVQGQRNGALWSIPALPAYKFISPPPGLSRAIKYAPSAWHIQATAFNAYPMPSTQKARMLFYQMALGNPTQFMLLRALKHKLPLPWPELTTDYVRRFYINTIATAKGHLHRTRKNIRPTHASISQSRQPKQSPTDKPVILFTIDTKDAFNTKTALHTDTTGAINDTHVIFCAIFPHIGFIHYIAMTKNPTNAALVEQYIAIREEYAARFPADSLLPMYHVTDDTIGKVQEQYFRRKGIHLQVVPPDAAFHDRNQSERAGQTAKAHAISTFATLHKKFPRSAIHLLIPLIELTLNQLLLSDLPGISTWERLRGKFDANRHELYPAGTLVAVYDPNHTTWAPRALTGFYLGPSTHGYRSHKIFVNSTSAVRDSVSVQFLPHEESDPLPHASIPNDIFVGEPTPVIDSTAASPLQPVTEPAIDIPILHTYQDDVYHTAPQAQQLEGVSLTQTNHLQTDAISPLIPQLEGVQPIPPTPVIPIPASRAPITQMRYFGPPIINNRLSQSEGVLRVSSTPPLFITPMQSVSPISQHPITFPIANPFSSNPSTSNYFRPPITLPIANPFSSNPSTSNYYGPPITPPTITNPSKTSNDTTPTTMMALVNHPTTVPYEHPDDFMSQTAALYISLYDQATSGPDKDLWMESHVAEWNRHLTGRGTLRFDNANGFTPPGVRVAKIAYAARIKRDTDNNISQRRTRVAYGIEKGKRPKGHIETSSTTVSHTTFKLLLNSTISDPDAALASLDINDFYIQHDAADYKPAYVITENGKIPPPIRIQLGTEHLSLKAKLVFQCMKVMYGQDDAGKISQDECNAHLKQHGYVETSTTCLYKSTDPTDNIIFIQWSDDILIKYNTKRPDQLNRLLSVLKSKYPFK